MVSLALPGMNTVDQRAQLEQEGFAYQPDVVLLGLRAQRQRGRGGRRGAAGGGLGRGAAEVAPPSLLDRSALLRWVRSRLWATRENRRRVSGYLSMYADDAPGWIAGRQALEKMGALCRARGVPFVVAIFPLFGNPLDERYPFASIHAKVGEAAAAAGARVVDLLPAYRGLRWDAAGGGRRGRRASQRDRAPHRGQRDPARPGRGGAAAGPGGGRLARAMTGGAALLLPWRRVRAPAARWPVDREVADVLRYRKVADHVLDVSWNPYQAPRLYPYPPVWVWVEAGAGWLARHSGLSFPMLVKLPTLAADLFIVASPRWGRGAAAPGPTRCIPSRSWWERSTDSSTPSPWPSWWRRWPRWKRSATTARRCCWPPPSR